MEDPAITVSRVTSSTTKSITSPIAGGPSVKNNAKQKQVRFVGSRRKWKHNNFVTQFYEEGSKNVSKMFPSTTLSYNLKWNLRSWRAKTKKKTACAHITVGHRPPTESLVTKKDPTTTEPSARTMPFETPYEEIQVVHQYPTESSPYNGASPTQEVFSRKIPIKETIRSLSLISPEQTTSDSSILSSSPMIVAINEYARNSDDKIEEGNLTELYKKGISSYVSTCDRLIRNVILSTNNYLAQYVDLNDVILIAKQPDLITVSVLPTWNHIRILQDVTNRRFIALKNGHNLSLLVSFQHSPLPDQRWICYPIESMNTLENELRMSDTESLNWLILRLLILKRINRYLKKDSIPMKLDVDNILLVSSSCGMIMIFKESQHEFDIGSNGFLQTASLEDAQKRYKKIKKVVIDSIFDFFQQPNIIPTLIYSLWPMDNLAYILSKLVLKCDKF